VERVERRVGGAGEGRGEQSVIEHSPPRALRRIDEHVLEALGNRDAIPEAAVREPRRSHAGAEH